MLPAARRRAYFFFYQLQDPDGQTSEQRVSSGQGGALFVCATVYQTMRRIKNIERLSACAVLSVLFPRCVCVVCVRVCVCVRVLCVFVRDYL